MTMTDTIRVCTPTSVDYEPLQNAVRAAIEVEKRHGAPPYPYEQLLNAIYEITDAPTSLRLAVVTDPRHTKGSP